MSSGACKVGHVLIVGVDNAFSQRLEEVSLDHDRPARVSRGLYERFYQDTVDNIAKWLDGQASA